MTTVRSRSRVERGCATRRRILTTAERLYAERGLHAVSNRQISAAAGQGNNTAVGYHFGTKTDLVRAILREHHSHIEELRRERVTAVGGSRRVRDWVGCLVHPFTEHLASLGAPTWFARFAVQVMADPAFRPIMAEESLGTPTLRQVLDGFRACSPHLPDVVRAERGEMVRTLLLQVCAERERALAEGAASPGGAWSRTAAGLVDALTGLWTAPVTRL